jgi:hypothetical protein
MFEKHRAKQQAAAYAVDHARWAQDRDDLAQQVATARDFAGDTSGQGLVLKRGEALYAAVTSVSLIEERRSGGHWQSGSQGVSIPIGSLGGHAVRYHVGATRGHYVQGTPAPTAIDTGTVYVTDQRIVFTGSAQTRECRFDKLLSCTPGSGCMTLSVSNRQKPTTLAFGAELDGWFGFRLTLALAHFRGDVPALVSQLEGQLAALDEAEPAPPPAAPT